MEVRGSRPRNDVSPSCLLSPCRIRLTSFDNSPAASRSFFHRVFWEKRHGSRPALVSLPVVFFTIVNLPGSPPTPFRSAAMRLFLIPISTRRALIYARPLRRDASKELSLLDKATTKVAKTWASWEEAEGGWKKHLVTWGNRVQQRIPFEEWGLKSIPSLTSQRRSDETHGKRKIDVLFPGNAVRLEKVPGILHTIATERQEFHRKKMIWSLVLAPITAPFALVPMYVAEDLVNVSTY